MRLKYQAGMKLSLTIPTVYISDIKERWLVVFANGDEQGRDKKNTICYGTQY